ncbi:LysR family transcriptional regulator [Lactobacillus sp. HT06-2]|uniref:LysR family transcriptional regulator n=1 Tax=Lactobacillus sp. HT06-2 TaxID=2080222 RepID=UPI000CD80215|nr:LysR family transcriptional regulator [Lactobacillus sp. HT06-2]
MNDDLLTTFLAVVKAGSFSKAANNLYISPVSVMKRMNTLEVNLDFKIFERNSQGIKLTPAGQSLYESAQEINTLIVNSIQKARTIAQDDKVTITIATSLLRSCRPITDLWSQTRNSKFKIRIIPFEDDPASLHNITIRLGKDIDLIVGPTNEDYLMNNNFDFFNLGDCSCNIAVPQNNRLALKKKLDWTDLAGQTMLLLKKRMSPKIDELRNDIKLNHPQIKIVDTSHFYDMEIFNYCVENNYLMECPSIWENIHPSIISLPMNWDYTLNYGILSSSHSSKEVKEFISLAGELYLQEH